MDYVSQGVGAPRPGAARPRGFDANMQAIASAAHLRGVVLMKSTEVVGTIEAAELCRTIRAAREKMRGKAEAFDHVERLANGIATGLGTRGAIVVSQSAWNQINRYLKPKAPKE